MRYSKVYILIMLICLVSILSLNISYSVYGAKIDANSIMEELQVDPPEPDPERIPLEGLGILGALGAAYAYKKLRKKKDNI